jgi:hypothetical protein
LNNSEELLHGIVLHTTVERHLDWVEVKRGREDVVASKAIVEPAAAGVFAHEGGEDFLGIAFDLARGFLALTDLATIAGVEEGH